MFNNYPYGDLHEINLDWFLKQFQALKTLVNNMDAMLTALQSLPDASGASDGQVLTADGNGGWRWKDPQSGSGTGWTSAEITLLETILKNGTYITDQGDNIDALITSLNGGSSDSVTLSANSGSVLVGNTITITASTTGTGTLQAVSSDTGVATVAVNGSTITITAIAAGSATITVTYGTASAAYSATVTSQPIITYTITNTLTNVTNSNAAAQVDQNDSYTATLTADAGYTLDSVTVTMGGSDVTATVYNAGAISIAAVTGNVIITASAVQSAPIPLYNWDLTSSLTDTVQGVAATPYAPSGGTLPAVSANGMVFSEPAQVLNLLSSFPVYGKTIEIDIASFQFVGDSSHHARLMMHWVNVGSSPVGIGDLIFRSGLGWSSYGITSPSAYNVGWSTNGWGSLYDPNKIDAFNGTTVRVEYDADGNTRRLYVDGELITTDTSFYFGASANRNARNLAIGGISETLDQTKGDQCYNMTITGIRIYQNL